MSKNKNLHVKIGDTVKVISGIEEIAVSSKVLLDKDGNVTLVEKKETAKSNSSTTGARTPSKDFIIKQREI